MSWPIIGRRFTPETFREYVAGLTLSSFRPEFIVVHNTWNPTLTIDKKIGGTQFVSRPQGLTEQHIKNLHGYYQTMGWKGGPHLFVDQNGIWVFNPLTKRGTHSPSWNDEAWGVEMLGNFDLEPFDSGPGEMVRDYTIQALRVLCEKGGFDPSVIRLHKEDPKTKHKTCPGKAVHRDVLIAAVKRLMSVPSPPDGKIVVYKEGFGHEPFLIDDIDLIDGHSFIKRETFAKLMGTTPTDAWVSYFDVHGQKVFAALLKSRYHLRWDNTFKKLFAVEKPQLSPQKPLP